MARMVHLTPAECVLKFMGMTAAARACGVSNSTVWRWGQPKPIGSGGLVPSRHHKDLIARSKGKLTTLDVVMGRKVRADSRARKAA